jgi:ABC-type sugar transport system ATPase subunit
MSETVDSGYVLDLKGISKTFPGVKALDHVHFRLRPGSVHALCGENGAGKSTLMKIINGIYEMDEGEIHFKGKSILPQNPKQMLDIGVVTIHQELSPILDMTVSENIFLGREPRNRAGLIDVKKLRTDTEKLLAKYGLSYSPQALMRSLSISDIALIEIVKAISRDASVVIMDEPTSSITDSEVEILFENIKLLKSEGTGIIYISHKLDEVFAVCDEVTIFRDGRWVHHCAVNEIDKKGIIEKMVGRELTEQFPKTAPKPGNVAFAIKDFSGNGFSNINLEIREGEIVGIAGLVGAGRSETFRAVFGLDKHESGEVLIRGKPVKIKRVQDAINAGIIMTSEDRKHQGIIATLSVRENIILPSLNDILAFGLLNLKREKTMVAEMINKLLIKVASHNHLVSTLSGGNQQKVVLAKWLLKSPMILILDEPTRGIDVGAKYEIYKLMGALTEAGAAIIMVSSELPELLGMCDRIAVMSNGKLTGTLNRSEFSQNRIMELAIKEVHHEQH